MLQKLEILESAFDRLDNINKLNFSYEKFKEVNSDIENILVEINSNELNLLKNNTDVNYNKILANLLKKIDNLGTKILPKANLLEEFSKSKI